MLQNCVDWSLAPVRLQYSEAYIIHYMDDIILSASVEQVFSILLDIEKHLNEKGFIIGPDKIQKTPPFQYLGTLIEGLTIWPQKMQLYSDKLKQMISKKYWYILMLWHYLEITINQLSHLFKMSKGNPNLASQWRTLSSAALQELQIVEEKINEVQL